jgi:hypothetical protein
MNDKFVPSSALARSCARRLFGATAPRYVVAVPAKKNLTRDREGIR